MSSEGNFPNTEILGIRIHPPMAIARVGSASEPVAAYAWELDRTAHGGMGTVVRPRTTLTLDEDGSVKAELPESIAFKDEQGRIRPVAPFFEIHAVVRRPGAKPETVPLTLDLMAELGIGRDKLRIEVIAANRKAESRTKSAACAAIARVVLRGDDHERRSLDAVSPRNVGEAPMVSEDRPLRLGQVQMVRPVRETFRADAEAEEVDLGVVRLRFTPGTGATFGPPEAGMAPASPLAPGELAPAKSLYGPIYEVVPKENRILTAENQFLGFCYEDGGTSKWPTPVDSYDGSRVGERKCWGNIDDTCDATISAELVFNGRRHETMARVFAGPPDFAPDRRHFYNMYAELEDRDLPDPHVADESRAAMEAEVIDLFRRIFETVSLLNLDQRRAWALSGNAGMMGVKDPDADWDMETAPKLGPHSMRAEDAPYADRMPEYTPSQEATVVSTSGPADRLPYTEAVQQIHGPLADAPLLLEYLVRRAARIRGLIRPPYARFGDLPPRADFGSAAPWRDIRTTEGQLHDMRMPPYMRHSMGVPLAITQRQYRMLMAYLDFVAPPTGAAGEARAEGTE